MPKARDITGKRFGSLVVLSRAAFDGRNREARWHVRCNCGKSFELYGSQLRRGQLACRGCSQQHKKWVLPIGRRQITEWRKDGESWDVIEKRLGLSRVQRKRLYGTDRPLSWRHRNFEKMRELRAGGMSWPDIGALLKYPYDNARLANAYYEVLVQETLNDLHRWITSPHGRVFKAIAEGYTTAGPGSERANVSGREWSRLSKRRPPRLVREMLELDMSKITDWVLRGTSWRDIRTFSKSPIKSGYELRAIYDARSAWDRELEPRIIEDELAGIEIMPRRRKHKISDLLFT